MACGASREHIGVVELGIVKDANQATAVERTLSEGAVDYGERKLTVHGDSSVCRVVSSG